LPAAERDPPRAQGVTWLAACAKHCPPTVTVRRVFAAVSFAMAKKCFAFNLSWNCPGLAGARLFSTTFCTPSSFDLRCHWVPLLPCGGSRTIVCDASCPLVSASPIVRGSWTYDPRSRSSFAESAPAPLWAFTLIASFGPIDCRPQTGQLQSERHAPAHCP